MKLLRIVTSYNAMKKDSIARQTNYIKLVDLEKGPKINLKPQGKNVKSITIELVESKEIEARVTQMDKEITELDKEDE